MNYLSKKLKNMQEGMHMNEQLILPKVTVILRGYDTEQVLCVVEQLVGTRLNSVEVALNSPHAIDSIREASSRFGDAVCVGAGTVRNFDAAKLVIDAGAKFMLSPVMFDREIIDYAHEHGVLTVPSAFSPSEVARMIELGADIVKIFPAADLGPKYLSDIQAPLGKMPLMVVGGINAGNVQEYFDAGATYAGIGSGIFDPKDVLEGNAQALRASIKRMEDSIVW